MKTENNMEKEKRGDLAEAVTSVIDELKQEQKLAAVHTYTSTLNSYILFCREYGYTITLADTFITGRLKDYQSWLRRNGLSWNSVSTYLRTLRAIYNRICPPGSPRYNPKLFEDLHTKVESHTKRALTGKQMKKLLTTDSCSLPPDLQRAMAYFLLMFLFRGMPFIDLAHLNKKDMKGNVIIYCRHKTGKQMTVRIPGQAMELIEKYRDRRKDSPYLFPILNPEEEEAWELHQSYLKALRLFNKEVAKMGKLLLGVRISSYTPRHTWATLSYYLGVPVGLICEALGHSSIRVTENYLKPFEKEKVDKANDDLITFVMESESRKRLSRKSLKYSGLYNPLLTK
ncbi:tyrosine-type recombinase/integrase [Phocaeicola sp.]